MTSSELRIFKFALATFQPCGRKPDEQDNPIKHIEHDAQLVYVLRFSVDYVVAEPARRILKKTNPA